MGCRKKEGMRKRKRDKVGEKWKSQGSKGMQYEVP